MSVDRNPDVLTVDIPVTEVTLLEDRAQVVREGTVDLSEGFVRLAIAEVSPLAVDRTLTARLVDCKTAVVLDARIRRERRILDKDRPQDVRELEAELRHAEAGLAVMNTRSVTKEARARDLATLKGQYLAEVAEEAAWAKGDSARWHQAMVSLGKEEDGVTKELSQLAQDMERAGDDISRLKSRIAAARSSNADMGASLRVDVESETAGSAHLYVTYTVPCACWRPWHSAELSDHHVRLTSGACVWQNTGEVWRAVKLHFSTERTTEATEPPQLDEDVVRVMERRDTVVAQARDQAIQDTGLGAGETALPKVFGIEDGGDVRLLHAPETTTILSDGRPTRIQLSFFEGEAHLETVVFGECAEAAVIKTTFINTSDGPLLPGPVELIRGGGPAGRTRMAFISPGERVALGWGADPAIRVTRTARVNQEKHKMLSNWVRNRHEVSLALSNLSGSPRTVHVKERIPISEIEKVEIAFDPKETTGRTKPDADGFLTWILQLAPYGHDTVNLAYVLARHSDVVGV